MQFNTDEEGPGLQSEINITPLVDVVLVLLIIFMVVAPMLLKGYDVNIPRATAETKPAEADASEVVLTIAPKTCPIFKPPTGEGLPADCRVSLDEHEIPAADLPVRVAQILGGRPADQRVLFLAVDSSLNYEAVLRIVDFAKSNVDDLRIEFVETN
jgi:biopolymer transport protein ExbD